MDPDTLNDYRKAGKIAADALQYGRGLIKKKSTLLDVTDKVEQRILKQAKLAFPVQISCNHIAAHYYPDPDDTIVFEDQVVKLDVGVQVNGAIGDTACTVDLSGNYTELVKASADALDAVLKMLKPGLTLGEIGATIQKTITSRGFAPVRNLSGHGLDLYDIHTSPTVPNTATGDMSALSEGDIIAIEPFASTGAGLVIETSNATLYQLVNPKPVRDPASREIVLFINQYEGLPFAKRWLLAKYPPLKVNFALKQMLNMEILREYAPLADRAKGMVSQAEHSVLITKDGAEVLTKA